MEDNTQPHTAATTQKYLEDSKVPKSVRRPQSPDFNPIENVGLRMKRVIAKRKKILKSIDEVLVTAKYVWESLPSKNILACIKVCLMGLGKLSK